MIATSAFDATVVITTKNRKDELRLAVASCLRQTARVQVIVVDDGSTDGTAEMVRSEFPGVRLERSEVSRGYIAQRNRGGELAAAPFVFSIDDDAVFESPRTIEQTVAEFDHPRVGAVAVPYIDTLYSDAVCQRAPDDREIHATAWFRGTAYAIRKDVFLELGGFREHLTHQCEEPDLSMRMLDAGYIVRLGRADPIHHNESPRRDLTRMITFNARNNLLFAWQNVPMPYMPVRAAGMAVNLMRAGVRLKYVKATVRGIGRGLTAAATGAVERRPVQRDAYALRRELEGAGSLPLSSIAARLAALEPKLVPATPAFA